MILEIRNLHVTVEGKEILRGIDLVIRPGEVHALMGPNGSGKSTLSNVLAGRPGYEVTRGEVLYRGRNLLSMKPEERAREGLFLAFQYPVEIPGLTNGYFLRAGLNAIRTHRGQEEIDAVDFLTLVKDKMKLLEIDASFLNRSMNEGFSGGEKKRNEILQMLLLDPVLAVLDETDSGLDIDALRVVANGISTLQSERHAVLVITHYQRLLNYLVPDFTHVLIEGRIARSGDRSLVDELEQRGYGWLEAEQGQSPTA